MDEEAEDKYPELRQFPPLWPLFRSRSKSDTSGFRARVLCRLRGACSGRTHHQKTGFILGVNLFQLYRAVLYFYSLKRYVVEHVRVEVSWNISVVCCLSPPMFQVIRVVLGTTTSRYD